MYTGYLFLMDDPQLTRAKGKKLVYFNYSARRWS